MNEASGRRPHRGFLLSGEQSSDIFENCGAVGASLSAFACLLGGRWLDRTSAAGPHEGSPRFAISPERGSMGSPFLPALSAAPLLCSLRRVRENRNTQTSDHTQAERRQYLLFHGSEPFVFVPLSRSIPERTTLTRGACARDPRQLTSFSITSRASKISVHF
jgi:hypothetical protein